MTSSLRSRPSSNDAKVWARSAAAGTARPPGAPVRRRWGRVGAGVGAAIVGGWIFAALYLSAGERSDVLVVANDVGRLEVIDRSDLRVVRLSDDSDVASVPASRLDEIVGRVAGVDLVAGSLLADGQVLPADRKLLSVDEVVVGVLLGPGDAPQQILRRGTPVLVVVRPAAGTTGVPEEIEGWVYDASGESLNTRDRPVEVAVPRDKAGLVSAAAADGRVSVVVLAE